MKTLLVEPFSGIAGDMFVGALLDLGIPIERLKEDLRRLPLVGWTISSERTMRGAFAGTRFLVGVDEGHPHRDLGDVRAILEAGGFPDRALRRALAAFERLAGAEGRAHGRSPEDVHFHEVGAVDSILDVAGAALLLEYLDVDRVLTTRIRVGTGEVECRHGRIAVPAPGTAALLEGLPVLLAEGEGETTTPTGAALLNAWAEPVGDATEFTPERTGYGAGSREDTTLPNLLRVTLGTPGAGTAAETVVEFAANLDDMTPEAIAFAMERLLEAGALDAWAAPVQMKKGRPGTVLSALATEARASAIERVFLNETTTLGVRRRTLARTVLAREIETVETEYGPIRIKTSVRPDGSRHRAPEYEDCARLAREYSVPLRRVFEAAASRAEPDGSQ